MSQRRNTRRSIWTTISRRRAPAPQAPRFTPNRAPSLARLFAGTALGCTFLAFVNAPAARAADMAVAPVGVAAATGQTSGEKTSVANGRGEHVTAGGNSLGAGAVHSAWGPTTGTATARLSLAALDKPAGAAQDSATADVFDPGFSGLRWGGSTGSAPGEGQVLSLNSLNLTLTLASDNPGAAPSEDLPTELTIAKKSTTFLPASIDPCGNATTTGDDVCTLDPTVVILGALDGQAGTDTLRVGTVQNSTIDVGALGSTFVNFEAIEQAGPYTTTLSNGAVPSTYSVSVSGGTLVLDHTVVVSSNQNGILVTGGELHVTSGSYVGGFVTGIRVQYATGDVTLRVDGLGTAIYQGAYGSAINGYSAAHDLTIVGGVGAAARVGSPYNAVISATASSGDVSVTWDGSLIGGSTANGYGVYAHAYTGDVSVSVGGSITNVGTGIWNTTSGAASVDVDGYIRVSGRAVYARSDDSVTVTGSGTLYGSTGIFTRTAGAAAPTLIDFDGTVHGDVHAVDAASLMGDSDLTIVLGGVVGSDTDAAVQARVSAGSGDLSVTFASGASVRSGHGVALSAYNDGAGAASVTVEDGAHLYGGVYVGTSYTAQVTIDGTVRNEFTGINLTNSHDAVVTVGATGSVYARVGYGIVATSGNDHITIAGDVIGVGSGAIQAGPGYDTITLQSTASIVGNVVAGDGTDTLELAGPGTGTANVGQFTGFELGHASGGTWSLTGTDATGLAWTIDNGATLNVTSDSLNADVVDNGVLQLRGSGAFTENVSGAGVVQAVGGGTVTVNGDITTGQGLQAVNTNLTVGGDVTAAYGRGVYASSTGVDLSIDGASTSDISARSTGILAVGTTGDVTVNWQGDISSGYHGVYAHTNDGGDVSITVGDVVSTFGEGVFGRTANGGDITIHTLGAVTESGDSGIRATAYGGGDVSVTAEGDVHAYNYGITAFSGSGATTVTSNGSVTGHNGTGLSAFGNTSVTVNVNGAVDGHRNGVNADSSGFADVNINADVTGGYDGVRSGSFGGSVDIDIAAGADVTGGRYGVNAYNFYGGTVSVTVDGTATGDAGGVHLRSNSGNLEVLGSGDISSGNGDGINVNTGSTGAVSITNTGSFDAGGLGVFAGSIDGAIDIDVADVTSAGHGVYATTNTGGIQIDAGDIQSNGGLGISAYIGNPAASSDIGITVTGMVSGQNGGIMAINRGYGGITVDVSGSVIGAGFSGQPDAITLVGASSDVTIGYTGLVSSNNGRGLVGTAGADVVRIQGTLAGFNGAADLGGGDDTVYLYAGAHVYGAFNAGTGNDRLFLTGSGDATFDFDSGQFTGFDYGRIIGTGHWTLVGTDTIGFGWSVGPGGALDGDTNSLDGDITDNGTVNFDQNFDGTFEHDVTGTGNVTVQGGGTLTFTGDLYIDGGIDILDSSGVEMDGTLHTTGDGVFTNIAGDVNIGVGGDVVSGGDGVDATATGGRVIVTTDSGSSITAGGDGIVAHSDIGISIYNNGTIVADPGMNLTATGNADIYVNSAGAITADNGGIVTSAEAGPTLIKVSATVEGDDDNNGVGNGIQSTSTTGSITIHNYAGGDIVGDNASGIVATSQTGAISIDGDVGVGLQADSTGIFATASGASAGGIDIEWLGSISAGGDGVYASLTSGGATGDVDVTVGAVTAAGVGVLAQTWGSGDVNVTLEGDTTAGSFGVQANNHGSGDVFVTTTATGDISGDTGTGIYARSNVGNVTVTADGDIGSAANHVSGYGIQTVSTGAGLITIQGSGNIYADSIGIAGRSHAAGGDVTIDFDGDITSGSFGVLAIAIAGGDSDLSVTTGGAITSASTGVYATNFGGTGDVDVTVDGAIFAGTGAGIQVRQNASGDVNVTTSATGDIITGSNYGVRVNNYGTGDTTIDLAGDVGSLANPITFAVNARTTGLDTLLTVNTSGAIYGSMVLAATGNESDISVDVSGPVSNGMFIRAYGAGDTDVSVDVSGHVSNTVVAGVFSGASTGLIDVDVTGRISSSASAISVNNAGTGGAHVGGSATSVIDGSANYGVNVVAAGGTIDIDADGAIGSLADRVNLMGVFATQTGVDGQIDVSVSGTIYSANQGVTTRTTNTGGDTQITVSGTINAPFGVTGRAYAGGDSDVSIDVSATGSILGAANAVYGGILNAANTGTVDIDFAGAIDATNAGLWGVNAGSGGVNITTYAGSSISGNAGSGIIANGAGGAVAVTAGGTIGSAANEVSGNGIYGRNPGAGSIVLTSSGDIFADQFGIYGRAAGSASITIDNAGDVTAGRTGLRAIGSTGAVSVANSGTVTVDGTNPNTSSMGVYAFTNNNVSIDNDGDITVVSNDSNIVAGVRIVANNGFAEVYSAGDINVTRNNGSANTHAIVITDSDLGAHVVADGDIFVTTGGENFGAIVITSGGAVDVDAAYFNVTGSANGAGIQVNTPGAVTVNLTEGHVSGVNAEAVVIYGSLGAVNVNVGEASTSGADSQGILVGGGATGAVTITAGSVVTNGAGAHGIQATTTGHIDITATNVTTLSGGAAGILADGDAAGVEIHTLAGGVISASGTGVSATTAGSTGDIYINAAGAISGSSGAIVATTTAGGIDIRASGLLEGDADYNGAGSAIVATSGSGSISVHTYAGGDIAGYNLEGIHAFTQTGGISVQADGDIGSDALPVAQAGVWASIYDGSATADVSVSGSGAVHAWNGIYAANLGSGAVNIDFDGAVYSTNVGIDGFAAGVGDVNITVGGEVTSAGIGVRANTVAGDITLVASGDISADGTGIITYAGGEGATHITATGLITAGRGIYAGNGGAGLIDIDVASIDALGTAIFVTSYSGGDMTVNFSGSLYAGSGDGVYAAGVSDDSSISVTGSGSITAGAVGVRALQFGAGDVSITLDAGSSITAGASGISAISAGGAVNITAYGDVSGGEAGIQTSSGAGATAIVIGSGATIAGTTGDGVHAVSTTGDIYLYAGAGALLSSNAGDGLEIASQGGNIHVVSYAAISGDPGVVLSTTGAGVIDFDSFGAVTGDAGGILLQAEAGAVTLNVHGTVEGDADNSGAGAAIGVSTTTGSIDIHTFAGGDIIGDNASGILAVASGAASGHVAVDIDGNIGSSAGRMDGVGVQAAMTSSSATGLVSVTGDGDIWAQGNGVDARNYGVGGVQVDLNGELHSGYFGVLAGSLGAAGDVTVTTRGAIFADYNGIVAYHSNTNTSTGDVTVTANGAIEANGAGIYAWNYGTGDIRITTGADADIAGSATAGVRAWTYGGDVTITTYGDIGSAADAVTGDGIVVRSGFSPASGVVTVHTIGDVYGGDFGGVDVLLYAGGMDISITTDGNVSSTGSAAVRADMRDGGDSTVTVVTNGDVHGGYQGIFASLHPNNTGDLSVTVNGSVYGSGMAVTAYNSGAGDTVLTLSGTGSVSGASGIGLSTYGNGGDTTIHSNGAIGASGDAVSYAGILARMGGAGTLRIDGSGAIFAGEDGIDARGSGGDILIQLSSATADIVAGGDGISAVNGGPAFPSIAYGDITILTNGTINAGHDGIYARINAGTNAGHISITANDAIGGALSGWGVYARAFGGGIDVTTGANGDIAGTAANGISAVANGGGVTIHNNGDIGASGDSVSGFGIRASQSGSSSLVTIDGSGAIFAGTTGIAAQVGGANADILVNLTAATADIRAGTGDGIQVSASGTGDSDLTVFTNGTIQAGNNGVDATVSNAANTGSIVVTTHDTITASGRGVRAQANGAGSITITTDGAVNAGITGVVATATSGAVNLYINGDVTAGTAGAGDAVAAFTTDGDIYISTAATATLRSTLGDGIEAGTTGSGDIHVESRAAIDADPGIILHAAGSGDILLNSMGAITADNGGIVLTANSGDVDLTVSNTVEGDDDNNGTGAAIYARSVSGTVTVVTTAAGDVIGDNASGIVAITTGASAGGVHLTLAGDVGSAATPVDGFGVYAGMSPGTGAITIDLSGDVHAGGTGVEAYSFATGGVTITTAAGADITAGGAGVYALSAGADADVYVTINGAVTADGDGVRVAAFGGGDTDATVISHGQITAGGDGVSAFSGADLGSVLVTSTGLINAQGVGINATGLGSGDVVVNQQGGITGAATTGIQANSSQGATFIHNDADIGSAANAVSQYGLNVAGYTYLRLDGAGAIFSDGTGVAVAGNGTGGDVVVDLDASADIVAGGRGLIAVSADGDITIDMDGTITAHDYGILAAVQPGGTGDVTINANDRIDTSGRGVFVSNNGSGAISITTSAAGDITGQADTGIYAFGYGAIGIHNAGDIGSAADTVTDDGVYVQAVGAGSVVVDGSSLIFAGDDGIEAHSFGGGDLLVNLTSAAADITAGGDGIMLYGWGAYDTDLTVFTNGSISAGQDGIDARIVTAANTGAITVTANDAITGALTGWGVRASTAGNGGVTVTTGADADISGSAYGGVMAIAGGGGVTVHNNGDIGSVGDAVAGTGLSALNGTGAGDILIDGAGAIVAGQTGILAFNYASGGDITINLTASSADIIAGGDGVRAISFGGGDADITLVSNGAITAGGNGLYAYANGGTGTMQVTANDTIAAGQTGIRARNRGTGGTTVIQNAIITGSATYGVEALAGGGDTTVHNNAAIGSASDFVTFDGVRAVLLAGGGTVLVDGAGAIFAGDDGIDVRAYGDGSDIIVNLASTAADIVSGDDGISAYNGSSGDNDVTIFSNGTITGNGDGVQVGTALAASTGTVSITLNDAVTMSGASSWGTRVDNQGTGGVTIVTGANGDISGAAFGGHLLNAGGGTVSVSGSGDIGSSVNAVTNDGVRVTGSAALISMTGSGPVFAGDDGFDLNTSAAGGDIVVNLPSGAIIRSTDDGVYASTTGTGDSDITITLAGSVISTSGNAVDARITNVANTGTLIINANASLTGGGVAAGIRAENDGVAVTSTIAINVASGVSVTGGLVGGASFAIDTVGGPATINNAGTINGFVDLSNANDVVNNSGLWNALGTSAFGGGTDAVNNTGRVEIAPASATAITVLWTGVEAFNNQGGVVDLRQGHVGDVFSMAGATFTGSMVGPNASVLQIDASLTGTTGADRLVIGAAAGATSVQLVDLAAAQPGSLDLTGALVVDATAGTATNFTLQGGPIRKGFVEYRLTFDGVNSDWRLVGLPSAQAFQMLKVGAAAQDFSRHSTDAWTSRTQEMRDADAQVSPTRGEGWEMWGQAQLGSEDRGDQRSFSMGGATLTPDLSTSSDWRGFQMGADKRSGAFTVGLTTGFIQQETSFDSDGDSFDVEGWNLGGYLGWSVGGFFANGLVKADSFSVDANLHSVPAKTSFDGVTWGAKGEIGFRLGGPGFYVEPIADLAWSKTDLDDATFSALSTSFKFDDTLSNRGSLGVRVGGTWGSIAPFAGVYAVEEFEGQNRTTMFTGAVGCPSCVTVRDDQGQRFGRAEYGFTVLNWSGLEGFVKGETSFGGDASGTTVRLGARWRW